MAVLNDFLLRFTWTITMSVTELELFNKEILKTIFGVLEVFRLVAYTTGYVILYATSYIQLNALCIL